MTRENVMVAYNFTPVFAPRIEAKTKRGTIRMVGKRRHARAGETITLYTGLRTKAVRLLGHATCMTITPIRLNPDAARIDIDDEEAPRALIGTDELHEFSRYDGFDDWGAMVAWFRATYPGVAVIEALHIWWGPTFIPGPPT